jgi:hypothetical protein
MAGQKKTAEECVVSKKAENAPKRPVAVLTHIHATAID